jgi:hypothetical protein
MWGLRIISRWMLALLVSGGIGCAKRTTDLPLATSGQSCGERFCQSANGSCQTRDGGAVDAGEQVCDWNGTQCIPVTCGGTSAGTCPTGTTCTGGICNRASSPAADRTACQSDDDCVPEPCCRPTLCVSRADVVCRTNACCTCLDCLAPITGCRCVNGCCVTDYGQGCS